MLLTVLCTFCFAVSSTKAQTGEVWPRLERSYINHFYQEEDSYSNKCFEDAFIDQQGRLCLIPCGVDILINSIGLFYFDGYTFQPVALFTPEGNVMEVPWVRAIDNHGRFVASGGQDDLYLINPDTRQGHFVPAAEANFREVQIIDLNAWRDTTFVLGKLPNDNLAFFRIEAGQLVRASSLEYPALPDSRVIYDLTVAQKSIWTATTALSLYRFDRQQGTLRSYTAQDFEGYSPDQRLRKSRTGLADSSFLTQANTTQHQNTTKP